MNIKHKIKSTLVCSAILASIAIANGQDYSFEKIPLTDTNIAQLTNVVKTTTMSDQGSQTTVIGDKVRIQSGELNVDDHIVVGTGNTLISDHPNVVGENNLVGIKAWYYTGIQFTTNSDGKAILNSPATIYLTDDVAKRNNKSLTLDPNFVSGYTNGFVLSIVNKDKLDNICKVTEVNGNAITVDSVPFTNINVVSESDIDIDDWTVMTTNNPFVGCISLGDYSYVMGSGNKAYRRLNMVFGRDNTSFGDYAFIGGRNNQGAYASLVGGRDNSVNNWYSFAFGRNCVVNGQYSMAGGRKSKASADWATALGFESEASGNYSFVQGYQSSAEGSVSFAHGNKTHAQGTYSHAEGNQTYAIGQTSHAEGNSTKAYGANSHAEGNTTLAYGSPSHAEGTGSNTEKTFLVYYAGEGTSYTSSANHGLSANNVILFNNEMRVVTSVPNNKTFVVDSKFSTNPNGQKIRVVSGVAYGNYSHSEGMYTKAIGEKSHAEGRSTIAFGDSSHSEGTNTLASADFSHAEGYSTKAMGQRSHAEGESTVADGKASHAEGNGKAYGNYSHAGGWSSKAYGTASFVHGNSSIAATNYACVLGNNLIASNANEFVCGKYNNPTKTDLLFSIGNGTSTARKNAMEVTTGGTVYILMNGSLVSLQQKLADATGTINPWDIPGVQSAAQQAKNDLATTNSIEGIKNVMQTFLDTFIQPQSNP